MGCNEPEPVPLQAADDWLTPRRFAALLGVLIFAVYPEVLTGQATFFHRDFAVFGYPLAFYHRESFWRGEMPNARRPLLVGRSRRAALGGSRRRDRSGRGAGTVDSSRR